MYYIFLFILRILYFIAVILLWFIYAAFAFMWLFNSKKIISLKRTIEWASEQLENNFYLGEEYISDYDYLGY